MEVIILLVVENKNTKSRNLVLMVCGGRLSIKLKIKEKDINDLLYEFRVTTPGDLAGNKAIIDIDGEYIFKKPSKSSLLEFSKEKRILIPFRASLPRMYK